MTPSNDGVFLRGAFAPLRSEYDCADLRIEGRLPAGLEGTLYRIGPNPQFTPLGPYNPLQGDGMVHAFKVQPGRVSYRNRWVRTAQWRHERHAGRALFATADPRLNDPSVAGVVSQGAANTPIVSHGGRLLALEEGHPAMEMDGDTLETLGPHDFNGQAPGPMTAHPKVDAETGEMLFFANFPNKRFDGELAVNVVDARGTIVSANRIRGPYPALVHDFAITRRHIVFVVCPLTLSLDRLRAGGPAIAWEADRHAFVGVVSRQVAVGEVRWLPVPACMVWHVVNAFDDGDRIVLDVCQQEAAAFPAADGRSVDEGMLRQFLTRWIIDLEGEPHVRRRRLTEVVCEYPRIDERRTGQAYRYGFVAAEGGPGAGDPLHRALGRFDHDTGEMALWRAAPGQAVSEPVFVAARGSQKEGDGYLLATVFDEACNASHLAVLDAQRIEEGPIARAFLDHRVPAGFHGTFVATD